MILLALLAAAAPNCEAFVAHAAEPIPVTVTAITVDELGGKPATATQAAGRQPHYMIGDLDYYGNGVRIRSSDRHMVEITSTGREFRHPCGYVVDAPSAWDVQNADRPGQVLKFVAATDRSGPPANTALASVEVTLPGLHDYVLDASTPIFANGGQFFLGLMHRASASRNTVLVAWSDKLDRSPPRILASFPMRFEMIGGLPDLHSANYHLSLDGHEADGTLNRLQLVLSPLQRDALTREFGDPSNAALNLCPVGGEPYERQIPGSFSMNGNRPDGRPYGSVTQFPLPMPECPTNKLAVFDRFTEAETARLAVLIRGDDYRRLIQSEPPHYRASWLATQLGRPEPQALDLLLQAIWQVTPGVFGAPRTADNSARFTRYQTEFLDGVRKLSGDTPPQDRLWLEGRAANAARQLGRFSDAETMRQKALATLKLAPTAKGWDSYLANLGKVITRKDDSSEPLDMIPSDMIRFACQARTVTSAFDKSACPPNPAS